MPNPLPLLTVSQAPGPASSTSSSSSSISSSSSSSSSGGHHAAGTPASPVAQQTQSYVKSPLSRPLTLPAEHETDADADADIAPSPATTALAHPRILAAILAAADNPLTLLSVNRSTASQSISSRVGGVGVGVGGGTSGRGAWRLRWMFQHADAVAVWAAALRRAFRAPTNKLEWLAMISEMQSARLGSDGSWGDDGGGGGGGGVDGRTAAGVTLVCGFMRAADVCGAVARVLVRDSSAARFAQSLAPGIARHVAGSHAAQAQAGAGAAQAAASDTDKIVQTVREAIWIAASLYQHVATIEDMFNSPFGTTLLPQSPSLVNAAVFAVMRSSTGESTELLESLLRQVPRVRESLTDLHHFAIRLGKIAYVRLLVGGWPQYTLGPRIIALLNHAYQNEDEDIVQYLLDYTGLSPNVATIVAAWKALHDVEAAAEEPVVSETLHTYVVTSVQTCLRKAVLDKNGGDGQQDGPETLLAPPQSQSIRRMYWTSLVEMACSKGMTELVRQLLDVSRDAEFRSLNLRTTVKMLALAVDGNFADMADMLVDSITGDPMPVFEGSDPSAGFQARLMLQPSPLGMSGVSHAAAQSTASMDPEASISRTGMALFSGLPSNAVERCEELLYRYCSLPNSALFVALFPFYQLSELPDWAEAIKVHRIDTISYLIESGTRRAATQGGGSSVFHIRDDCIWAAFQAGNVEIAQILQSAGGNVGWMESTGVAAPQLSGIAASWNGIGKPSQGAPVALSRQGTDDNGHMDAMGFDSFRLLQTSSPVAPRRLPNAAMALFSAYGGRTESIPSKSAISGAGYAASIGSAGGGGGGSGGSDAGSTNASIRELLRVADESHAARYSTSQQQLRESALASGDKLAHSTPRGYRTSRAPSWSSTMSSNGDGNSNSSSGGGGVPRSRTSSLFSRLVRGGLAQTSEDQGWTAFLAGKTDDVSKMMAANTMLSWMEPPSLAAPVVLSSPARVGTPSGAAAAAAAAAGPGVFQSSVLASVGLDASGASGTFSPKTVAMGGDVPDAYAVYGALGGTLY